MRHLDCICLAVALVGASLRSAVAQTPTIVVEAYNERGRLADTAFGANHRYDNQGLETGKVVSGAFQFYADFLDKMNTMRPGILRFPGGTIGNVYHWQRAIGPQAGRTKNAYAKVSSWFGTQNNEYGPDEFGRLLEAIGGHGVIMANFATGNAQEAADWVEYMNAPAGTNPNGGTAWADARAANGHPAPYGIQHWEVGNEYYLEEQSYWLFPEFSNKSNYAQLFCFGGSIAWTQDPVVEYASFAPAAAQSDGTANQVKYARYPPVATGEQLFVGAEQWTRVDNLSSQSATAKVYTLDYATGRIAFGNGTHGAIPPNGQTITLTYTSGPHDGFVDFYAAMKAADPTIQVYSSLNTPEFCQTMGTTHPYDGLVKHYYPADTTADTRTDAHNWWVTQPLYAVRNTLDSLTNIRDSAGGAGKGRSMAVTECGHPLIAVTTPDPGESIDGQTISEAMWYSLLYEYLAEQGCPMAMKHMLTDKASADQTNHVLFHYGAGNTSFGLSTMAVGMTQLDRLRDTRLLASWTANNPAGASTSRGTRKALQATASRDADDALLMCVTNLSAADDVTAHIVPLGYQHAGVADIWEMNGPHVWSNNFKTHLNDVAIAHSQSAVGQEFDHLFPAHSITVIKLAKSQLQNRWTVLRHSAFDQSGAGAGWYLTGQAAVTNSGLPDPSAGYALRLTGGATNHGRATLTLPSTYSSGVLWLTANVWAVDRTKPLYLTFCNDGRNPAAAVALSLGHDGRLDSLKSDGTWGEAFTPFYNGAWMKLDVLLDLDANLYDVWLDDYKVFVGEALPSATANEPVKKVNVETGATASDAGDFYVDNVKARQLDPASSNIAPTFAADPLTKPDAAQDVPYSASLSGDASDPDAGETLTFGKVSGPAWLTVAPNGALGGAPSASDLGDNSWIVSVSDGQATTTAALSIHVRVGSGARDWDRY
ncbi:MAG: hypothetical protein NTW86_20815 [Candidatus Sumerlaeota bacterium]|nr:hypothetical protein [Candidatus Sumerlaeota bacterium]